ncbi:MAG: cytochrome P450, partial [Acidobacteriota bacterium]
KSLDTRSVMKSVDSKSSGDENGARGSVTGDTTRAAGGTLLTLGHVLTLVALVSVVWVPAKLFLVRGAPAKAKLLLFVALATYLAVAISITFAFPDVRPMLLGSVVGGWVVALWRAQPRYGDSQGRPLGSLGLSSSFEALSNYDFYHNQSHRFGPIFKSNQYFRPVLCVIGLERCQTFLRDNRDHLTSAPLPINRYISGGLLRYMETDQHRRYRRLLASCMTPRAHLGAERSNERTVRAEVSALAKTSQRGRAPGVKPFAAIDKLVYGGLIQLFFAIEPDSSRAHRMHELYRQIDHRRLWRRRTRARQAIDSIVEIVRDRASELTPEDVVLRGSFLAEAIHDDRQRVEDPIFVENLVYFLHIARCDLDGLCAWLLKMLCDHPKWALRLRQLRCDGERREDTATSGESLADRFVKETLRLRQSEYLYRTVAEPIKWKGFSVPAGWLVRLCIRESHVDANVFDRPTEFDPDRFADASFSLQQYQPFGIYEHACMGAYVTAMFGRILVQELADRYACTTVRDGPMEPGLHHHNHWRPSSRLKVRLEPVSEARRHLRS